MPSPFTRPARDGPGGGPRPRKKEKQGEDLAAQSIQWATPSARDWRSEDPTQSPTHSPPLGRQVLTTPQAGLSGSERAVLNPQFVEALQGLPIMWTDCGCSETL